MKFLLNSLVLLLIIAVVMSLEGKPEHMTYSAPTELEVKQFIKNKDIPVVATKQIGNSFTVVLFQNGGENGHYSVYKDQNGKIYSQWVRAIGRVNPVDTGGVATGIPFVTVIINDENILNQAATAIVDFKSGKKVVSDINGKGLIIANEDIQNGKDGLYKLTILDEQKNILYEQDN